jgi:hypothetical protein
VRPNKKQAHKALIPSPGQTHQNGLLLIRFSPTPKVPTLKVGDFNYACESVVIRRDVCAA